MRAPFRKLPCLMVPLAFALCAAAPQSHARASTTWVTSWSAAPQPPVAPGGALPASPSFGDQTLVQVVKVSVSGQRLRVRLTNAYGNAPLQVGRVQVGIAGPDGAFVAGTVRDVAFSGDAAALVPAGAPLLSDPIDLATGPGTLLGIRMYLPGETGPCTCHSIALQDGWVLAGDQTALVTAPGVPANLVGGWAFVTAVEVESAEAAATIAILGDSLADGMGSSQNANQRWPDLLGDRLNSSTGPVRGIANLGISGNRLLAGGAGESALARFDRDVLAQPELRYVIVSLGINDIGASQLDAVTGPLGDILRSLFPAAGPVDPHNLAVGYRQLIARARSRGLKVYGATITPFGGAALHTPEGEAIRQAVNSWIRTSGEFDAVIDFDAVWRDSANPERIREDYQSGDYLHGNDAGYRALAEAVDLSLFAP